MSTQLKPVLTPAEISAVNQRICSRLVDREVHFCVSGVVARLMELDPESDDLPNLSQCADWETPAADYLDGMVAYDLVEMLIDRDMLAERDRDEMECIGDLKAMQRRIMLDIEENEGYREFCEQNRIDPEYNDVYEHWAVSSYLAERLEALGESVGDVCGLTVWGRCTTGQAISMDAVIESIASGMGILHGQPNEWEV